MLQNVQVSGINLGVPNLSRLTIHRIDGDYDFKEGVMTIETFEISGQEFSTGAKGTIDLPPGTLNIDVNFKTPKPTLAGELASQFHLYNTLSNPKVRLDSLRKEAFKASLNTLKKFLH